MINIDKEKLEELVNEAKTGNKEAFSELIKYVEHDLYNIAKSRLPSDADAQDVLQITKIVAYINIGKLKEPKLFKAWIVKILINACNKFYKSSKVKKEISYDFSDLPEESSFMESDINFDDMIKDLPEEEQELLRLKYKEDLTFKTIANELNLNEGTVKSRIYRSLGKLRKKYSLPTICMFILCFLIATTVIAVSIISYIQSLFSTSSVGIENPGVLMAIEHKDWFQKVDMDYIDLGNGYKIKVDYLLMDEMCLYMVFDFVAESEDISGYTDIIFPDLKITDENNNIICDELDVLSNETLNKPVFHLIENTNNHCKVLLAIYANSFPKLNSLNVHISNISLENTSKIHNIDISNNITFNINLDEKFINRKYTSYVSNDTSIERAIISETGFYALVNTKLNSKDLKVKLIDENGNKVNCFSDDLVYDESSSTFNQLISATYNNFENKKLKLVINNKQYILAKE